MRCPGCDGKGGTITPRQTEDGRTVHSHDECPVCDGTGAIEEADLGGDRG